MFTCAVRGRLHVNASTRLQRNGLKRFIGRIALAHALARSKKPVTILMYANTFIFLYDAGDGSRMASAGYVRLADSSRRLRFKDKITTVEDCS